MKMYHSTTQAGREGILRDGLKTGQSVTSFRKNDDGGYTKAGEWADEYYGTRPVYLAMQQGLYSQLARQLGLEFEVEVDPNTLVADLPSLVDTGAYIESGGMYWEYDDVPSAMKPVADGDGWIAFEELLQPGSIAAKAAIDTTGTAASLNDIPQERVVQLTSESILREYIRTLLECGEETAMQPIMDPLFNMREMCKEFTLLEDHLNQPDMQCHDCINKHLMKCEALAEEAISLDKESRYPFIVKIPGVIRGWHQRVLDGESLEDLASSIRPVRKKLTPLVVDRFEA